MIEKENIKPIKKYEISVDWHLKRLKSCIMSHYKDVNMQQYNFQLMDETAIEKILDSLKLLIRHCKEIEEN